MAFEAGMVVGRYKLPRKGARHRLYLIENRPHRLEKSLGDLSGLDHLLYQTNRMPDSLVHTLLTGTDMGAALYSPPVRKSALSLAAFLITALTDIERQYGSVFESSGFHELLYTALRRSKLV